MKELAIGETFVIEGQTIKCVEDTYFFAYFESCKKCFFGDKADFDCLYFTCCSYNRTDGKNVHFELVEE